jgi:hypothetical protein
LISSAFSLGSMTCDSVSPHDSDDLMWPAKLPAFVGQAEMQLQTSLQVSTTDDHNSESVMGPSLGPLATTNDAVIGPGELTLMRTLSTAPASTIQHTSPVASAGEPRRIVNAGSPMCISQEPLAATRSSMPASGRAGQPGLFTSQTVIDANNLKCTSAIRHFGGDVYWFNNTN